MLKYKSVKSLCRKRNQKKADEAISPDRIGSVQKGTITQHLLVCLLLSTLTANEESQLHYQLCWIKYEAASIQYDPFLRTIVVCL